MARLLRTKTLTPNKRKGDGVVTECVQKRVKSVCIDVNRYVSESETESDREQSNEVAPNQPRNQTKQATKKKKKKTLTREEKALAVADNILRTDGLSAGVIVSRER